MKVARRTRKGMAYQRGERWGGMGIKGILLGWCSQSPQHGAQDEFVLGQAGGFGEYAALASLCWTAEAAVSTSVEVVSVKSRARVKSDGQERPSHTGWGIR
jgi:hypothetical protein